MSFKLKCPLPGCSFGSQAETKEELVTKGLEHAKTHGVTAPSPDLVTKISRYQPDLEQLAKRRLFFIADSVHLKEKIAATN